MKNNTSKCKAYIISLVLFLLPISSFATDGDVFTAKTVEGIQVTYTIYSEGEKTCGVGYEYNKKNGILTALSQETTGSVTIPSTINGYTVIAIEKYAFYNCKNLNAIYLNDGIVSIGESAFNGCKKVKEIKIPNSVQTFGGRSFLGCECLISINIPERINSIGELTFYGCIKLESVKLPDGLIKIANQAFYHCKSLTEITLPGSLREMDTWDASYAFAGCTGLKKVTICEGVSVIGSQAFSSCNNIDSVIVLNKQPISENNAFKDCRNAVLLVPSGCKSAYTESWGWKDFRVIAEIGETIKYQFSIKSSGVGHVLYNGIKIEERTDTFEVKSGSTETIEIVQKDVCQRMKMYVTNGIDLFKTYIDDEITNPYSVNIKSDTRIEVTFEAMDEFTAKTAEGVDVLYKVLDLEDMTCKVGIGESKKTAISATTEGHLTIPNIVNGFRVIMIDSYAFNKCKNITGVSLPDCLDSIGVYAFEGCESLEEIEIPGTVSVLSTGVFSNCTNLSIIKINEGVTCLNDNVFQWCTSLSSIALPNSIKEIGQSVFYGCSNLSSVKWAQNVHIISKYAFQNCISLMSIDFFDNINSIGNYAFANCSGLSKIDFPSNLLDIGEGSFSGCINLENISLPEGLKTIGSNAFDGCTMLSTIKVGMKEPITITSTTFCNKNSKVYVPKGSKQLYKEANGWNDFIHIIELYNLNINCSNGGYIKYLNDEIRNDSRIFEIEDGQNVLLSFYSDKNYKLTNVIIDGTKIHLNQLSDGENCKQYWIENILSDISITASYAEKDVYCLALHSIGNGSVICNNDTVRNEIKNIGIWEKARVNIHFVPDSGYMIKSFKLGNEDITNGIVSSSHSIDQLICDTTIEVVFFEDIKILENNGVNYEVDVRKQTATLIKGYNGIVLTVPSSFEAKGLEWKVTAAEYNVLSNNKEIAAVIWNADFTYYGGFSNPNLLFYVKDERTTPIGITNLIVNGEAETIRLVDAKDGNNFFCPQAFTAKRVSYIHNYSMKTGYNSCKGWESIVLPFDVTRIQNASDEDIVPFEAWNQDSNNRPFWLYSLSDNEWKAESRIKANTPYIISMPNNDEYDAAYNLSGDIQFIGENVQIESSENLGYSKSGDKKFVPNYQNHDSCSDIYALNVNNLWSKNTDSSMAEGSAFIRDSRKVRPFEAYMTIDGGGTTRSINIFDDNETTGIMNLPLACKNKDGVIRVYSLSGMLLKQGNDEKILNDLPKGVYVVNGKKIVK